MVLDGNLKKLLEEAEREFNVNYSMSTRLVKELIDKYLNHIELVDNAYKLGFLQGKKSNTKTKK